MPSPIGSLRSMHDSFVVRGSKPARGLDRVLDRAPHRQGPILELLAQRLAVEQLGKCLEPLTPQLI